MMGETLGALVAFRTGQQDSNLGRPNVVWEILIGCRGSCDYLQAKHENIMDKIISPNFRHNILCIDKNTRVTELAHESRDGKRTYILYLVVVGAQQEEVTAFLL